MPVAADLHHGQATLTDRPSHWMPISDLAAHLERVGIWRAPPLCHFSEQARLDWLAGVLEGASGGSENSVQCEQLAALEADVQGFVSQWMDEYHDAFNEELSRILLGEGIQEE